MTTPRDSALPEEGHGFDYDLVVVGGGSGGLALSKAAAELGKKVAVLDYVRPSPQGTTWGLGGTCVNVGCIPKKLMHTAVILGESVEDAKSYGWELAETKRHNWNTMVQNVQDYIKGLNFGYRTQLRSKGVEYINAFGSFVDPHTMECVDKKGGKRTISARRFCVAVGGRPKYPDIPGAREHCITSDDLFSLQTPPGKTLVVGASYVALECAGFLTGLGYDTTVMMRSIPLRGFDQQCAESIVTYMENHGTTFLRNIVPTAVEKQENGKLKVSYQRQMGEYVLGSGSAEYDTVLLAIGRDPECPGLQIQNAGIATARSGKIVVNEFEQTNIPHIYAIGDVTEGRPELTPVAIAAGRLLAARLYEGSSKPLDYNKIPTTVFTPLEYGACGLPEERAIELFGEANVEVFHSQFTPLEWTVSHRPENVCYAKLVCNKADNNRVVGFHVLGPNAGEITQGFAIGIKMNATKDDFDNLIGIHPTCAEEFTILSTTKSSGASAAKAGC